MGRELFISSEVGRRVFDGVSLWVGGLADLTPSL